MRRFIGLLLLALLLVGCSTAAPAPTAPQPASPQPASVPAPLPDSTPTTAPPTPAPQPTAQELYNAAQGLVQSGDLAGAYDKLQQAVALDPQSAEAWNLLASVDIRLQDHVWPAGMNTDYKAAINAAGKAVRLRPNWGEAQFTFGLGLLAEGQYMQAIAPLQQAAKQLPQRHDVAVAVGLALLGSNRVNDAIAACQLAIEMQQDYAPAHHCLDAAGNGYKVIPATEAAVGTYAYQSGKGFVAKTAPAGTVQEVQINRPWTCARLTGNGYREDYIGCGQGNPFTTSWQFSSPGLGTTPAGVGVGSPWGAPAKAYGATDMTDGVYHYRVGDLHLTIQGSVEQGVQSLTFTRVTPLFVIEGFIHPR